VCIFLRANFVCFPVPVPGARRASPFRSVASGCCSHCVCGLRFVLASIVRALLFPSIFADDLVAIPASSLTTLNRNLSEYAQHCIRAFGPTPLGVCSIISLVMCGMLGAMLEWPAHPLGTIRSLSRCVALPFLPLYFPFPLFFSTHEVHTHFLVSYLARTPSAFQKSRWRKRALPAIFSSTAVRRAESCLFGCP
jgi:hypothetical protein